MSCWDILGIEQTKDLTIIKKAYSEAIKAHHPEEDPIGFQKVRTAYKEAEAYAKGHSFNIFNDIEFIYNNGDSEYEETTEFKGNQEEEERSEKQETKGDTFDKVEKQEPEGDAYDKEEKQRIDKDESYDFNKIIIKDELEREKKIQQLLDSFLNGYQNLKDYDPYWNNYFHSSEFKKLQMDHDFTNRFLQHLSGHNEFNKKTFHKIIIPMLLDWSQYWSGSEYEIKMFEIMKARKDDEENTRLGCAMLIAICFIVFIVIYCIIK